MTSSNRPTPTPTQSMGASTEDKIEVRGYDLCKELIGVVSFTDLIFLEAMGRLPNASERGVVDAILVTVTEHGVTPSSLASRFTILGDPDSLQGAVAAGLIGAGRVYLGAMEECAQLLTQLVETDASAGEIRKTLERITEDGERIPGVGHPIHVDVDPRVAVLYEVSSRFGFPTTHQRMMDQVRKQAETMIGRPVPINAGGAIAAVIVDAGLPVRLARGLAVIGRAAGLVGHVLDEIRSPAAQYLWHVSDKALQYKPPERG